MTRALMIRNKSGLPSIFLLLLICSSVPITAEAESADQKNFMWKVRSKTAVVYLLGSIHYLKKDAYPLNISIEDAFSRSNVLAVEANVNDPDKLYFSKFIDSVFYLGEDTLEKHVSRQTYELVMREFGKSGLPAEILAKEKPWFLALTLTALELLKSGFEPQYGIDMHFLSKAGQKRIVELESLDQQVELLSNFSEAEQEAFLVHTIKELDTLGRESDRLLQTWKAGDAKGLESIMEKGYAADQGMASIYEKLLYARNRSMTAKVEDFLRSKDTCFVIVGAGHLVGKKGIVDLLRAKGYAVEQM
jgi:uncharacterized protein YbaP (TraB family)